MTEEKIEKKKKKENALALINWPQILSITANNLKIHKNAEEIHNLATQWSGLDASVKEAENIKERLIKENESLKEKIAKVSLDIVDMEVELADITGKVKDKSEKVEELDKLLRSNIGERKKILEADFFKFKKDMEEERNKLNVQFKELSDACDHAIERKNRQIADADLKIKKMAEKLTGSL